MHQNCTKLYDMTRKKTRKVDLDNEIDRHVYDEVASIQV